MPVDGKKVIEHRITLGQKERDLLEQVSTGYTFNKVATPTIALLSDVTALGTIYLFAVAFWPNWAKAAGLPDDWAELTAPMDPLQIGNFVNDLPSTFDDYSEGAGPAFGLIGAVLGALFFRTPTGAAAGGAAGAYVGEEYLEEPIKELTTGGPKRLQAFTFIMIMGSRFVHKLKGN